jgi:hypothetical protein
MRWRGASRTGHPRQRENQKIKFNYMGKLLPRSFERIRSGEQIQPPTFANVAAAVAAGITAAKYPRRIIYLTAGGTGSVPCLAVSDGMNWRQIAIGVNAI